MGNGHCCCSNSRTDPVGTFLIAFSNSKKFVMKNSFVESHKNFLKQVGDETLLYKVVSFENFLKMLDGNYLHFNRVDNYTDDKNDSAQPKLEKLMNEKLYFEKDPNFTLRNYYEECRRRSYACCFSLDVPKADQWKKYGGKEPKKAVCLVINFGKLKFLLNETFRKASLVRDNIILHNYAIGKNLLCLHLDDIGNIIRQYRADNITQILHLNYGLVNYGDFMNDLISPVVRPNPIEYLHFKDNSYKETDGRELRISLSAIGMGRIQLPDGRLFDFSESIQFEFNLDQALSCGAISHFEIADKAFLPELTEKMKGRKIVFEG